MPVLAYVTDNHSGIYQAKQCLYEWRGGFASAAYELVKTHFVKYGKDVEACAAHATWLLDVNLQSPFLWKDAETGENAKVSCLGHSIV